MIGYLTGEVLAIEDTNLILNVSGVGYSALVPQRLVDGLTVGTKLSLHIYTHLRENALELFGFESQAEKRIFLLLTSVSGIGPRTALSILSGIAGDSLIEAIAHEDRASLTGIPGVGKKTVERIFVELADKAKKMLMEKQANGQAAARSSSIPAQGASASSSSVATVGSTSRQLWNDSMQALLGLGYREAEAMNALKKIFSEMELKSDTKDMPKNVLDKVILASLKILSRGI